MKKWLFVAFLSVLYACSGLNEEDIFLINYKQQFTQQLANAQEETIQEAIFQAKINHWLKPKNAAINNVLKEYQTAVNQLVDAVKRRENITIIEEKIYFVLFVWEKINNRFFYNAENEYEVLRRIERDSAFNDKIANFYQFLSFVEHYPNDFSWNVLEMETYQLLQNFSAYIEDKVHFDVGMYDAYSSLQLYTKQPIMANQRAKLHFCFTVPFPERCQILVNQKLVSQDNETEYEFTPTEKGLQEFEIVGQLYQPNGDTTFLSKKIQINVEK